MIIEKDFKVGDSFNIYRIENNDGYLNSVFTVGTFRPGDKSKYENHIELLSNLKHGGYYILKKASLTKVAVMRITKLK